jgi:hypothetical protein
MEEPERTKSLKTMVWGWFLIGIGLLFLLDRFDVLHLPNIGLMWPLTFVVIAALQIAEGRPGSALMFILMGAWFQACTLEWYGLTYRNSWPLLLIVAGVGIVVRAFTGEDEKFRAARRERRRLRKEGQGHVA